MKGSNWFILAIAAIASVQTGCKKDSGKNSHQFDLVSDKMPVNIPASADTGSNQTISLLRHRLDLDSLVKSVNSSYTVGGNLKSLTLYFTELVTEDEHINNSLGNFSLISLEHVSDNGQATVLATTAGSLIRDTLIYAMRIPGSASLEIAGLFRNDTLNCRLSGKLRKALSYKLTADAQIHYKATVSE